MDSYRRLRNLLSRVVLVIAGLPPEICAKEIARMNGILDDKEVSEFLGRPVHAGMPLSPNPLNLGLDERLAVRWQGIADAKDLPVEEIARQEYASRFREVDVSGITALILTREFPIVRAELQCVVRHAFGGSVFGSPFDFAYFAAALGSEADAARLGAAGLDSGFWPSIIQKTSA